MNKMLIANANMFYRAYHELHGAFLRCQQSNDINGFALLTAPMAVNCAFACELYLKAIVGPINKHNLDELFQRLDHAIAEEIVNGVIQKLGRDYSRDSFQADLNTQKDIFVRWRYLLEGVEGGATPPQYKAEFLRTFLESLCEYVSRSYKSGP